MANGEHHDSSRRISLSQETLVLELENMELRMKDWMKDALDAKASKETVDALLKQVTELIAQNREHERWKQDHSIWAEKQAAELKSALAELADVRAGNFGEGFKRSIRELIGVDVEYRETRTYTRREKLMGVGLFLLSVSTFVLSVWHP